MVGGATRQTRTDQSSLKREYSLKAQVNRLDRKENYSTSISESAEPEMRRAK